MSTNERADRFLFAAALCAIIAAAGIFLTRAPVRVHRITFAMEGHGRAKALVTIPAHVHQKSPVVFLLPGIISLADRFDAMAGELARSGYASCALYFHDDNTRNRLRMVQAAVRAVGEQFPAIDTAQCAYFGHSLGGTTAVDAAYADPRAAAAISVGYYIGGELAGSPKNLLIGTGIYDDLNDREKLRASLRSVTEGGMAAEGVRKGDFSSRTARELFISPFSNHASEKEDCRIIEKLVEWLDLSFGRSSGRAGAVSYLFYYFFGALLMVSLFFLLCLAGIALPAKVRNGAWAAALLSVTASSFFGLSAPSALAAGYGLLISSAVVFFYYSSFPDGAVRFTGGARCISESLLLWAFSFSLSQFLFSLPVFLYDLSYVRTFPGYLYTTFFVCPLSYVRALISYAWHYMYPLVPLLMVAGISVWLSECRRPGGLIKFFSALSAWMADFITYRKSDDGPAQKMMLAALLIVMVLAWWHLYRGGYLYGELMTAYGVFMLRYGAVPLLLYMAVRCLWRRTP